MRGNILAVTAVAVLLAGCATKSHEQVYRPRGSNETWQITGNLTASRNTLEVYVNGTRALTGSFGVMDWSKEMTGGQYHGKPISASCHKGQRVFSSWVKCDVFVEGERAAHFDFEWGV